MVAQAHGPWQPPSLSPNLMHIRSGDPSSIAKDLGGEGRSCHHPAADERMAQWSIGLLLKASGPSQACPPPPPLASNARGRTHQVQRLVILNSTRGKRTIGECRRHDLQLVLAASYTMSTCQQHISSKTTNQFHRRPSQRQPCVNCDYLRNRLS